MIDTHCHLNDREAFPEPERIVDEARAAGVVALIVIGVDLESSAYAVELAERFSDVFATVGHHPNYAQSFNDQALQAYAEWLKHPKVVGLGEIGLDFHWDFASPEQQSTALAAQAELARSWGGPTVFHCREAYPELLRWLESNPVPRPHFHCFAGDAAQAEQALRLGATFGVDGPITYKKADDLRAVMRGIGIDHLVLETDAPWLSPVPYRGKPNHPAYLRNIAEGLAHTLELEVEEIARRTTENALRFFPKLTIA